MYIHAALISNKVSVIRSRWGTVKRHGKGVDTNYEFGGQEFESLRARHFYFRRFKSEVQQGSIDGMAE